MADINQTDVKLNVNNQEAKQSLDEVKKKLAELEAAWIRTASTGDKAMRDKLNKQIQTTKRELRQMESGTKACERVFRQLNKAAPNDLRKALNHLQSELKNIERGTPAWDAHVQKIRQVKAEIDKVNAEIKESESLLVRMRNGVQNWGAMAAGAVAAFSGIVIAGKKAVNTYAEMQQEEANVRKYTGMTEEEVTHLNDAFKKMDTRTSREELNKLAQEAGRLGMQSEEDVLGFVRAADKINVALDDLGEGATLTLSKLTDIFGDRERLGTEQSLLAVGSVINELSQNSTAAAPYLAEFGQRLAGVGAQAHMTIPEIMGFGAVLDSQGQKLEMSATALSKVIMNLFKDPSKIAAATGLEIEKFSETCKRSTNEGLLMLLDRLHELGGIDALAPVFKDMGENGARASAVLAALAGNVDMVRQQQEAANVAFNEAISIDKEFNVQNTTVQAGLEKARKRFTEMSVTLGQDLMPIVTKIISSTSMTMRLMLKTIEFVKKYRIEILGAAAALATYYGIVKAKEVWDTFVGGCQKAIAAVKAFNKALLSNPYAAVAALIVGIGIALMGYIKRSKEAAAAADAHRKALERQQEAEKRTASAVGEVIGKYQQLKAEWERLSTAQEKKAWLDKNRDAFEQLGLHINNAVEADDAFIKSSEKVVEALKARARAEALQDLYKEKLKEAYEKAQSEGGNNTVVDTNSAVNTQVRAAAGVTKEDERWSSQGGQFGVSQVYEGLTEEGAKKVNEYYKKKAEEDVARLTQQYTEEVEDMYGKMYSTALGEAQKAANATGGLMGDKPTKVNTNSPSGGGGGNPPSGGDDVKAKLTALEDRKKREQAIEDFAYARGEKSYSDHVAKNLEIEESYHKDKLALLTKGSTEYYEEQARYEKQMRVDHNAKSLKEQQAFWADEKRCLDEQYMAGMINHEQYTRALEDAELDYFDNVIRIYEEGSEEYIKAQEDFQKKEHEIQKKRFDERKKIEDNIKKLYFTKGIQRTSDKEEYEKEIAALDVVYSQLITQAGEHEEEKLAIAKAYHEAKYLLAKEYNQKEVMETMDAWRAAGDEIRNFLESELGQNISKTYGQLVSTMSSMFSSLTDVIDAETNAQKKTREKLYNDDLENAGNNEAKKKELKAQYEKDIAKIESDAAEKKFKMQVIETVATGIQSAVSAWSAGWQTGAAGVVLAPLFMAMSLATTAVQIAALKKQQDLAASTGYASGGYTKPGRKDEPAGIVHAGEWVASQELLASPTAAATIAQLDQAQRTNTIGQLDRQHVSASVSAPVAAARASDRTLDDSTRLSDTLEKLERRLSKPFTTINTITGDKGTLRAQKDYERLMKNKS